MAIPKHFGVNFTNTLHQKAEGATDPENNRVPNPFVVLVTGAGKGVGYHICLAYARAGATGMIISSRTKSDLEKLKEELLEINPDIEVVSKICDTSKEEDVEELAGATRTKFDRLDVVVANAGIVSKYLQDEDGSNKRLPKGIIDDLDFERVMNVNVVGTARVARNFLPQLISSHDGAQAFVVITSLASQGSDSSFTPVAYNASKLCINRIVEHIHNDLNEKSGIQAFAVHPGGVKTQATEFLSEEGGVMWQNMLVDDVGLCGGFLTWLTKEKRPWLSGRYLSASWDVDELIEKKKEIVDGDKLRFRMVV